ncbi:MAG: hypothetical protein JWP58_2758 [Hymenobacter sp.]|nr:hypothetical protein [Hymenobacter sp.]
MPTSAPEIFRTGYQTLFEVHILHRYFLNVGLTDFEQAPNDPAVKAVRQAYDVRQFLRIEPSPATQELLRNQRLLFRPTAEGFCVLMATATADTPLGPVPMPAVPFPSAADFTFFAHLTDPAFFLYSALTYSSSAVLRDGQVLTFRNLGPGLVQGAEALRINLLPWPAGTAHPFALFTIGHRAGASQDLLSATGAPEGRQFQYVLRNQTTVWEYQGPQVEYRGQQLGTFPLALHGRIAPAYPLPFAVAAPTVATTIVRPGGSVYSLIY